MAKRTVISQLASVSEGAIGKLTGSDAGVKMFQGAMQLKDRVEKVVTDIRSIEDRVSTLERKVKALEGKSKPRTAARSTSSAKKPTSGSAASSTRKTTAKSSGAS